MGEVDDFTGMQKEEEKKINTSFKYALFIALIVCIIVVVIELRGGG